MPSKDYYAILMVHPSAERFVIEAAYKRLAREYHPDVSNASNTHEKMIDINEAYDVLSNQARRKAYDGEYTGHSSSKQERASATRSYSANVNTTAQPQNTARTTNQTTQHRSGRVPPTPPDPAYFGIKLDYLERAIDGARAWEKRERRIPKRVKQVTRATYAIGGIAILLTLYSVKTSDLESTALLAMGVALILLSEMPIRVVEGLHDARLKREVFNPRYNPNPQGYKEYAIEYAKYETLTAAVYVSRNWIWHSNQFCCGMRNYYTMPKWEAVERNTSSCSHCGYFLKLPKRLPPPFGNGYLPRNNK